MDEMLCRWAEEKYEIANVVAVTFEDHREMLEVFIEHGTPTGTMTSTRVEYVSGHLIREISAFAIDYDSPFLDVARSTEPLWKLQQESNELREKRRQAADELLPGLKVHTDGRIPPNMVVMVGPEEHHHHTPEDVQTYTRIYRSPYADPDGPTRGELVFRITLALLAVAAILVLVLR